MLALSGLGQDGFCAIGAVFGGLDQGVGAALLQGCAIGASKNHLEPELPEFDKAPYQDGQKDDQA